MAVSKQLLPLPDHYDSAHAGEWPYRPDQQRLFEAAVAWRERHRLQPAASDELRLHLLLIDLQKDFCFPEGALFVAGRSGRGAVEDNDRIARFIYRNLGLITDITCTLDSHYPYQIFFPAFWVDPDGRPPAAHRLVTVEDVRSGALRPNPAVSHLVGQDAEWLRRQVEFYCSELERAGKYTLYLWPPHCLVGSDGHTLAGVIHEARLFHAWARGTRGAVEIKGDHLLTENYSVLAPEVLLCHDGTTLARRNTAFLQTLLGSDLVVVAGQAASHCVKSTIEDLLEVLRAEGPDLVRKVYILADCMSAVTVPDPSRPGSFLYDFTPEAAAALTRFADAGMHVVRSTDPVAAWPGVKQ